MSNLAPLTDADVRHVAAVFADLKGSRVEDEAKVAWQMAARGEIAILPTAHLAGWRP